MRPVGQGQDTQDKGKAHGARSTQVGSGRGERLDQVHCKSMSDAAKSWRVVLFREPGEITDLGNPLFEGASAFAIGRVEDRGSVPPRSTMDKAHLVDDELQLVRHSKAEALQSDVPTSYHLRGEDTGRGWQVGLVDSARGGVPGGAVLQVGRGVCQGPEEGCGEQA